MRDPMVGDLPLVLYDLETTGLDIASDRIVEYAFASPDGSWILTGLVDPGFPIPADATEIHGITDEMVADAPTFADVAEQIIETIEGAVLAGYNSRQFDTPLLAVELHRAGFLEQAKSLLAAPEVDLLRVWRGLEPRSLEGAIRRFSPLPERSYGGLHRAKFDVEVLLDVFRGMVDAFSDRDPDTWVTISCPEEEVDRSGKFVRTEDGTVVFGFGKHKGVAANQAHVRAYLNWMLSKDFGPEVDRICTRILDGEEI